MAKRPKAAGARLQLTFIALLTAVLLIPSLFAPIASATVAVDPVSSISISAETGEKPQSKTWKHAGTWWAVLPSTAVAPSGTWLWRLESDDSWSNVLRLSALTNTRADAKRVGNVTHVLLHGPTPELVSIQYFAAGNTYQAWTSRPAATPITLPNSETATIDIDSTGRMWLATENGISLNVHYSDSPYSSFAGPITLDANINDDDIGVVTRLANNRIGVLWSNQVTKRFGFKVHVDGADPALWSADESPASQSANDGVGAGMADDHLNVALASDGTLYAAVKTGWDAAGFTKIGLLVRHPNATWDPLHHVDFAGTRGIVLLNEQDDTVRLVYTSVEGFADIVMKTSSTSTLSFGAREPVMSPGLNNATSTKENWTTDVLVMASSASTAQGALISADGTNSAPVATNSTLAVAENTPANGTLQATDVDADPLTYSIVAQGTKGTATVTNVATGAFTYAPNTGATGSDSFTFKANDGTVDSNVATVNVTISNATLVGHWKANESSGPLNDSSGFGNHATVFGNPTRVPGQLGNAIRFDGTGDVAVAADSASLDIANAITIAAWIRPEVAATQDVLKKATNASTNGYELALSSPIAAAPQKFFVRFNQVASGDTFRVNSTAPYQLNTWTHVAATYGGGDTTLRLYINGVFDTSVPGPASIQLNNTPLSMGGQGPGTAPTRLFTGSLDDARVYSRALLQTEIQALMGAPVNNAPVASNGTLAVAQDTPANGTLQATDVDADPLTYSIVVQGTKGTATVTNVATGAFTYAPNAGATGSDSFTFKANDGTVDSNVATVNVTIGAALVGHWRADEGSGTQLVDSSGLGNDAAIAGNPTWVAGRVGNAIRFDGTGDVAVAADSASLDIANAITIAAWIRPEVAATQDVLKKATNASTNGYELALSSPIAAAPQKFFVRFNQVASGDTFRVNSTAPYQLNTWTHVAATYGGGDTTLRLYINGVFDTSVTGPASIQTNVTPLSMGGQSDGLRLFTGALDDARLYSRALSAAEVQALFDSAPEPPDQPVLDSPADGATGLGTSNELDVIVNDPDDPTLTVEFFGRPYRSGLFELLDTQTGVASGAHATSTWSGLDQGQAYEWKVEVSDGSGTTVGPTWSFSTQVGADPVLVGAGDIAGCGAPQLDAVATSDLVFGIAGTVFTTGDNVYPDGTVDEFANCYDPAWGGEKTRTRAAPGNHDWNTGTLNGYNGYFGVGVQGPSGESYYSYNLGPHWHVVVLDSECARVLGGGCGSTSTQVNWLRSDLAAHAGRNVVAMWHKPRYGSGATNLADVQPFYDVLYQYGAEIVLDGHDHIYDRLVPIDNLGAPDATFGIRQITVGTGGFAHHNFGSLKPITVVRNNDTFGVLKLVLRQTSYDWTFLPVAGKTFTDSGTGSTHGAPNQAPTFDQDVPDQSNAEGAIISLDAGATDSDGDTLTYAATGLPTGLSIDTSTGLITGTIANTAAAGSPYSTEITVSDDTTVDDTDSFTWTVTNTNQAPTFDQDVPDQSNVEGAVISLDAGATDPDGDTLTYAATGLPTGLSINTSTGLITGTIANTAAAGSPYLTEITVSDDTTVDDTDSFTWTVLDSGGGNLAPTAFDLSFVVTKGGSRALTLVASDPGGDPLTYTIVAAPSHGTLSGGTGSVRTYTPVSSYQGKDRFTYKANDGTADSNIATVSIVVSKTLTVRLVDSAFRPKAPQILLGGTVTWVFTGPPSTCSATDVSALALFDSGPKTTGQTFSFTFVAAGAYPYMCTGQPTMKGTIKVPVEILPKTGGVGGSYKVTWSAETPPPGFVVDIQIKRGTAPWVTWKEDQAAVSALFTPDAGAKIYRFRARLERLSNHATSQWSPPAPLRVI